MTDVSEHCVNHLRVTFNLKADVVDAFVQDIPHRKLQGLRELFDAFGAKISSTGRTLRHSGRTMPELDSLSDLVKETMSKDSRLARKFDRQVTAELDDDRNVKAFTASLALGPYDGVIDKKSVKVVTNSYDETEISQAMDGDGIVKPPFPPANTRYVLE